MLVKRFYPRKGEKYLNNTLALGTFPFFTISVDVFHASNANIGSTLIESRLVEAWPLST